MNKISLIAGGNSGIGLEIAKSFFQHGSDVIILGRNNSKNQKAVQSIVKSGKNQENIIKSFVCDMSSEAQVSRVLKLITKKYGLIDNFINSVGLWSLCPINKLTKDFVIEMHNNNLLPIILGCALVPKYMNKHSSIVNLSSFAALMPMADGSIYSAYKASVINFTKSAADELAKHKIRVNSVTPGVINTPMTSNHISRNENSLKGPISLSKIGDPEEIAGPVLFLCSQEASYITGENIVISGGKYLVQK